MRIDRIFTRHIVSATRSMRIEDAAALMRRHHVGALVVADDPPEDAHAIGVLTDRDVVIQAVARGFDVRDMVVGDLMTPVVGAVSDKADTHEALELMREAGVRRLVVTDAAGEVVGILSMDDVIDGLAADLASLAALVKTGVAHERDELDD